MPSAEQVSDSDEEGGDEPTQAKAAATAHAAAAALQPDEAGLESESLSSLYERARQQHRAVTTGELSSSAPALQEQLRAALQLLRRCHPLIESLDMVSANDAADDVATPHLKYLLLPFLVGELLLKRTDTEGPVQRDALLKQAEALLLGFLSHCERLELMVAVDMEVVRREADCRITAAQARDEKVERYKRKKAEQAALKQLTLRKRALLRYADDEDAEVHIRIINGSLLLIPKVIPPWLFILQ